MAKTLIRQCDLVRAWADTDRPASRQRVNQLVNMGMPLTSIEAATEWREKNATRRERPVTVRGKGGSAAPKSTKAAPAEKKADSEAQAPAAGPPKEVPRPPKTGDSLLDALTAVIDVQEQAYSQVQAAMVGGKSSIIAPLLSIHSKAAEARFKAETMYREELERRGVLVEKQPIIESCRRCLDGVLREIKKLPRESGPQANPQDPQLAVKVLQRAVDSILQTGGRALVDL